VSLGPEIIASLKHETERPDCREAAEMQANVVVLTVKTEQVDDSTALGSGKRPRRSRWGDVPTGNNKRKRLNTAVMKLESESGNASGPERPRVQSPSIALPSNTLNRKSLLQIHKRLRSLEATAPRTRAPRLSEKLIDGVPDDHSDEDDGNIPQAAASAETNVSVPVQQTSVKTPGVDGHPLGVTEGRDAYIPVPVEEMDLHSVEFYLNQDIDRLTRAASVVRASLQQGNKQATVVGLEQTRLLVLAFVLSAGFYPRVALPDPANIYRPVAEGVFHTRDALPCGLHPRCSLHSRFAQDAIEATTRVSSSSKLESSVKEGEEKEAKVEKDACGHQKTEKKESGRKERGEIDPADQLFQGWQATRSKLANSLIFYDKVRTL
jgi:hypothetical protein